MKTLVIIGVLVAGCNCAATRQERRITASFLADGGLSPFDSEGPVFACRRAGPDTMRCADMRSVLNALNESTRPVDSYPGDENLDTPETLAPGERLP